ncbi:maleylpyruvate isomerase family mycothiol-dependent enzyme [Stackebrandtia nassauensis]|uniref:Mycothiol-dependent maleylpyruvate isomerase metal-binding domain-containing protein n=1 Tax=Stackebrandtia nassauensis (strain DSM 44728 / CIP 108903 / NRRL B-16338 / NBRC 102104 / LLR-40K-21) TaxID=446470 RepID=D3Q5A2_STANL|nr:maleylpyruvate isomerase family mycothiol-dependent enzyme [Stackebrandtia nassauensis]ADD44151.1 hypothetical protein Snas_4506 [Stackebrandtia nassauensis DSM 44728]
MTATHTPTITGKKVAMLADLAAERLDLADYLETLDDSQWRTTTLCPAWNVHQMLAHLTLSNRTKVLPTLWHVVKARGDFDRVEAELADTRAATYSRAELLAQLRETAAADRRLALAGKLDPLVDILVHGQDITRPLGHHRPMPVHRVVPALEHVWGSVFYGSRKRFKGLRFVATDADWSAGEGPEVRGPVGDILLAATGRAAGLDALSGPGRTEAAGRM